jgi:hypothetical protein
VRENVFGQTADSGSDGESQRDPGRVLPLALATGEGRVYGGGDVEIGPDGLVCGDVLAGFVVTAVV